MHDPGLYARSFSDIYDDWYHDLDDPQLLVDAFTQRCDRGATIVEFGGGTGRLAGPLCDAGFAVLSLDVSLAMLASSPAGIDCVGADMSVLPLRNECADGIFVAYNTLFNLTSRSLQQACIAEAARVLRPGAPLAIEGFISAVDASSAPTDVGVSMRDLAGDTGGRLSILSGVDENDPDAIVGSHIELHRSRTVCRPWRIVYQSPTQLDECANRSGLRLVDRCSDWAGTQFDDDSARHVSWYQKP